MRVIVAAEDEAIRKRLLDALTRKRVCTQLTESNFGGLVDEVIRVQPDLVILGLDDERNPAHHALVREVREISIGRIVVVGPTAEAKALLRFLQEGAFQYIDEADFASDFDSVIDRSRAEPLNQSGFGSAIALLGAGGGCGTSTLSVNTAAELSRRHGEVALIDLNLESGDLATLLNLHPKHTVSDFCRNASRMDQNMFQNCMVAHPSGVHLCAAPSSIAQISDVTPRGIRRLIHMAKTKYAYVIIDIGTPFRREHALALQQADSVVIALRPEFSSLHHAGRAIDFLSGSGIPLAKVKAVVNRYRRGAGVSLSEVESALGVRVEQVLPDDPRLVAQCNDRGVPVVTEKRRSAVAKRLSALAQSLNGATPKPDRND